MECLCRGFAHIVDGLVSILSLGFLGTEFDTQVLMWFFDRRNRVEVHRVLGRRLGDVYKENDDAELDQ